MRNKCTLIVDGNWLLQSRMFVMIDQFKMSLDETLRQSAAVELQSRLSFSITNILNHFKSIDNIIVVADGGSWRKKLPIPEVLHGSRYKGNRTTDEDIDWETIYGALNDFMDRCNENGITTSRFFDVEGDDWCWYWSRRLNSEGTHCIIWTVDNDLKQLVQVDNNAFTAWYSDRTGLFLPQELKEPELDDIEFFMTPQVSSPILEDLKTSSLQVSYIDPNSVILDKIICGDNSDNIKSIVRYVKNGKNRRIGEKEWEKAADELNIHTIQEMIEHRDDIIDFFAKKYGNLEDNSREDLQTMFEYNKKLVWLNENIIPENIQAKMCELEYKQYDVDYIRNNASVLAVQNDLISGLFDGIENNGMF